MDDKLRKLRSQGTLLKPKFMIGKNGLTDHLVSDIINRLKKDKLVKIKILNSYASGQDKDLIVEELAQKTSTKIVQFIGFTVVLTRK